MPILPDFLSRLMALSNFMRLFLRESRTRGRGLMLASRKSGHLGTLVLAQWPAATVLLLLAMMTSVARAQKPEVLDHVVAVINGSVILESDVQEDMRLSVLQPFSDPGRNTPIKALQRLIDRDLILQEMRATE
jgi:hypothetical protein